MTDLTREEKSLLLYFETQAVDYGGTLESVRMNADDFAVARRWAAADALRLMVRCGLKLNICVGGMCAQVGGIGAYIEVDFDGDPYAATRRAIVRAAAAMDGGKG